jgi:predicted DNA-binding transcriptional regulator YafY
MLELMALQRVSAPELATKFEVSVRTIYREFLQS